MQSSRLSYSSRSKWVVPVSGSGSGVGLTTGPGMGTTGVGFGTGPGIGSGSGSGVGFGTGPGIGSGVGCGTGPGIGPGPGKLLKVIVNTIYPPDESSRDDGDTPVNSAVYGPPSLKSTLYIPGGALLNVLDTESPDSTYGPFTT